MALILGSVLGWGPAIPGNLAAPERASAYSQFVQVRLPSPRSRTSAIWDGRSAYIFGGKIAKTGPGPFSTRQIVRFTPSTDIFGNPSGTVSVVAQLPPAPGGGRWDTAAIWDGQNAYIFGGYAGDGGVGLDQIVRFNPAANEVSVVGALPAATNGASAVWTGQEAYIFGGYTGTSSRPSDQILRFVPGQSTATPVGRVLPFGQNHSSAVWQGGSAYVYGGHAGQEDTDAVVQFDPGAFTPVYASPLPGPRHDTSAILSGEVAFVFGGNQSNFDDAPTNEIVAHDPQARTIRIADRLPRPLAYTSAVGVGRDGFIFGGEIGAGGDPVLSDEILRFTPPLRYVALGDSFSSGEGLGEDDDNPYFAPSGDPNANSKCHRHLEAYPGLFRFPGVLAPQLDFFACTGAETKNVYKAPQKKKRETLTQLARDQVNPNTEMVSLTIGGNDMGFGKVLFKCVVIPAFACERFIRGGLDRDLKRLRPRLNATIDAIQAKTGSRASIFVLGYPHLFPAKQKHQNCKKLRIVTGLSAREQRFLRQMVGRVRGVTARVMAKQGVHYVDVIGSRKKPGLFTGHEICGPKEDWINGLTGLPPVKKGPGSFHPNFAGHAGYAQALTRFIQRKIASGAPLQPSGLPANPAPKK